MAVIEAMTKEWVSAGIREGDTVLIHSSLKRTIKRFSYFQ
jgi:aminoglycoside N3'-acetyltransferase